jgi:hypothetical protein
VELLPELRQTEQTEPARMDLEGVENMGAAKTDHKRHRLIRSLDKACRQWDREDQAKEAAEVRRHNRAAKARKMKRLYPNSIAPERYGKIIKEAQAVFFKWIKAHKGEYLKMVDDEIINGTSQIEPVGICGIDLASGKDHTSYGGRTI